MEVGDVLCSTFMRGMMFTLSLHWILIANLLLLLPHSNRRL